MHLFSEHWLLLPWKTVTVEESEFLIDKISPVGLRTFFFFSFFFSLPQSFPLIV